MTGTCILTILLAYYLGSTISVDRAASLMRGEDFVLAGTVVAAEYSTGRSFVTAAGDTAVMYSNVDKSWYSVAVSRQWLGASADTVDIYCQDDGPRLQVGSAYVLAGRLTDSRVAGFHKIDWAHRPGGIARVARRSYKIERAHGTDPVVRELDLIAPTPGVFGKGDAVFAVAEQLRSCLGDSLYLHAASYIHSWRDPNREGWWHVQFRFAPDNRLHVNVVFDFDVSVEGQISQPDGWVVPSCSQDPTVCDVEITRNEAEEIARVAGLEPGVRPWRIELRTSEGYSGFFWQVSSRSVNRVRSSVDVVWVDGRTGEVLARMRDQDIR